MNDLWKQLYEHNFCLHTIYQRYLLYAYLSISFCLCASAIFRARASSNRRLVAAISSLCCSSLSPSHLLTGNSGKILRGFSKFSASAVTMFVEGEEEMLLLPVLLVEKLLSLSFFSCSLIFSIRFLSSLASLEFVSPAGVGDLSADEGFLRCSLLTSC